MNLNDFFLVSASVFCIVGTIFMIIFFVWAIILRSQINRLMQKLIELSDIAKQTSGNVKNFIDRTVESLETFKNSIFTFEFVRRIITEIIELIKNNKKGIKNG